MPDTLTRADIADLIKELKTNETKVITVLSEDEINVLKEIIKDRQAMSRAWNWLLWGLGSLSTVVISYGIISGSVLDWIRDHLK